ncbi:hypothetical protein K523DRAFT_420923 [Schizophyllum commune Tattone D]|nr:hypothetical protein K523DRAFT_420923 [Schizophyllum commune Tattone D]
MSPLASSSSMKALRTRASAGSVSNHPSATAAPRDSQENTLTVPSEPQSEWSTKRSRIPSFFARSRKKSTGEAISDTDSHLSSAGANRDVGATSEGRPSLATSIDTRSLHHTHPDEQPSHSRRILHLLSTKRTHRKDKPSNEPPPDLPGPSTKPAERKAMQPSITVSLSPDNLHEYQDLFTRASAEESYPTPTPSPSTTSRSGSHASEDDSVTPRQSNDLQSRGGTLTEPETSSVRRASAKRRLRPSDAGDYSDSGVESSPATPSSNRSISRDSTDYKRRTWGSALSADESSSITTTRRHRGSSALTLPRSTPPPNIPLPLPPRSRAGSAGPSLSSPRSSSSSNTTNSSNRVRTNTVSTLGTQHSSSLSQSQSTPSTSPPSSPLSPHFGPKPLLLSHDQPFPAQDTLDIENASAAELREALIKQNKRYDELVNHLRQVIDTHTTEKAALEKKVSSLTREVSRKDREIKGLTWVIVNGPSSDSPRTPSTPRSPTARSPSPTSLSSKKLRVRQEENDSGAESYATSGTEARTDSAWEGPSGASGAESSTSTSFLHGRIRTHRKPPSYLQAAPSSGSGLPLARSASVASMSSAARSTTRSTRAESTTSSSPGLSSIPEAVSSRSAIPLRTPSMTKVSSAKDREREREKEKEKARQARIAQRLASTPTPASAYAANLRTGRSPSIAQVLDKDKDR